MPPNATKYHLRAIHNYEYIEGTYNTVPELLAEYGELLQLTRRRVEAIRQRLPVSQKKYKHILINDILPEPDIEADADDNAQGV